MTHALPLHGGQCEAEMSSSGERGFSLAQPRATWPLPGLTHKGNEMSEYAMPKNDAELAEQLFDALQNLCDDLSQLEGSGPFVISHEFCQVNRERARGLLERGLC